MKTQLFRIYFFLIFCFCIACGDFSATSFSGSQNDSVTDPTDDVITQVTGVQVLLTSDVLNFVNDLREDIPALATELSGQEITISDRRDSFLTAENFQDISGPVSIDATIPCDESGSKEITSDLTMTLIDDRVEGNISGEFTIFYDNCVDLQLLQGTDGVCSVAPTVEGELTVTVDTEFTLISSGPLVFEEFEDVTSIHAVSDFLLDVSLGSRATDQLYDFSYNLVIGSGDDEFEGLVTFDGDIFDMSEIEFFAGEATLSVLCDI